MLETTQLTPAHCAGRLRYYARRVPSFDFARATAHFPMQGELTPT
jgi:hypothetical protein